MTALRRLPIATLAGIALAAAGAILLAWHVPSTFRALNGAAKAEVGRNDLGGALAAADMVGIDDDFVRAGVQYIPLSGRFAALVPDPNQAQATYGVPTTTILAVPSLMQDVLLPRREIQTVPSKGDYIVCYLCDTSPWDARTHWLWKGTKGDLVGLVYR